MAGMRDGLLDEDTLKAILGAKRALMRMPHWVCVTECCVGICAYLEVSIRGTPEIALRAH